MVGSIVTLLVIGVAACAGTRTADGGRGTCQQLS
jgi:hypothetical protein